jgi:Predicted transcriptional regulators
MFRGEKVVNIKMKIARLECGLSQLELAKVVKVTRQTISLIESGQYNPSLRLCVAICKAMNKTLNDLFWEEHS